MKTVVDYVKLDGKVSKQDAVILEYMDGKEVKIKSAYQLVMRKLTAANLKYEWQIFTPAQLMIAGAGEKSVLEMLQNDAGPACSDSAKGSEDFASADAVADLCRHCPVAAVGSHMFPLVERFKSEGCHCSGQCECRRCVWCKRVFQEGVVDPRRARGAECKQCTAIIGGNPALKDSVARAVHKALLAEDIAQEAWNNELVLHMAKREDTRLKRLRYCELVCAKKTKKATLQRTRRCEKDEEGNATANS